MVCYRICSVFCKFGLIALFVFLNSHPSFLRRCRFAVHHLSGQSGLVQNFRHVRKYHRLLLAFRFLPASLRRHHHRLQFRYSVVLGFEQVSSSHSRSPVENRPTGHIFHLDPASSVSSFVEQCLIIPPLVLIASSFLAFLSLSHHSAACIDCQFFPGFSFGLKQWSRNKLSNCFFPVSVLIVLFVPLIAVCTLF